MIDLVNKTVLEILVLLRFSSLLTMIAIEKRVKTLCRRYGTFPLYFSSFLLSVTACLSLGILALFSIFSGPLKDVLHYEQATINKIIIFQVLGLNVFTPLSGYIADAEGIWILPTFSFIGYIFGFNIILMVIKYQLHRYYTYFSFFLLGCSHVSLLFGCLLNSARALGHHYRTMAISTPNMMISISSFIQIQVLATFYKLADNPSFEVIKMNFIAIIKFFMMTLTTSTVLSFLGCKLADYIETFEQNQDDLSSCTSEHDTLTNFDTSPLLTGAGMVITTDESVYVGSPTALYLDDEDSIPNLDEELLESSSIGSETKSPYKKRVSRFVHDALMYPLLISCLLSIGSTEFFISNLGSILSKLNRRNILDQELQLLLIASTFIRILIMLFTDRICTTFSILKLSIFSLAVCLCGVSHLYLSSARTVSVNMAFIVICNSMLNSAVFTLFPAILAGIYGIEILGTTWGLCSSSSILGSMFLNLLYSLDYTKNCVTDVEQNLVICSTLTFFISGGSLVIIGTTLYSLKSKYNNRTSLPLQ